MNYYSHLHHNMSEISYHYPPVCPNAQFPSRYIYVKNDLLNPPSKVLINPHFKKKVFVNPQFQQPKIHVNPNVLKNLVNPVPKPPKPEPKSITVISTRNKLVRIPCTSPVNKRRNSLYTKYKIVRSNGAKSSAINKFKLDKREKTINKPIVKSVKKKYVYVNRFLSINVMAKNVLLKKNSMLRKPGFVNINGILYKKSPNSLRKASDSIKSSKYKLVRKEAKRSLKLIRSKKNKTPSKMRKCNIPCPIYRKHGKCPGKEAGTCFKLHNPDQIILCTRFLQGACRDENCLLSHKVSAEKMPTCKYFLDGLCSKDNCPYLHVKISPKADICRDFLEGFCRKGAECDKRHQFLCPEFEKNKKCSKRRCPYPHGNAVVRNSKKIKPVAKKCSKKQPQSEKDENNRYYQDLGKNLDKVEDSLIKTVSRERPKLGELPVFIPFS